MKTILRPFLFVFAALALSACGTAGDKSPRFAADDVPLQLAPASLPDLPGWDGDRVADALPALQRSCARILAAPVSKEFGADKIFGTYGDWAASCKAVAALPVGADDNAVRAVMRDYFDVFAATAGGHETGLFTGYYEASLRGSATRQGAYQTAIRARPGDLVMVDLGQFRDALKGQRIAGRVVDGNLKPYETRDQIEAEKIDDANAPVIAWVDDPVDAFFLHIQGSGRIQMDDGSVLRVGYAAQNGHAYTAIGRELIKRGEMEKDAVSMQTIRAWLESHPDQAAEIMNINASYVFFTVLNGEGPLGGENVALTPGRSLAVDRSKIAYGVPVWLDAGGPGSDVDTSVQPLRRLMVAQDTGGAIRGAVRGDVYFGFGADAEHKAGLMKSEGRYWLFLPKPVRVAHKNQEPRVAQR